MRAHIITTITRPRRSARHVLPLALGICALAIPATASASQYSSVSSITGGSEKESSQPVGSSDYSSANAITGGSSESSSENPGGSSAADSRYSSLNATAGPPASDPTVLSGSPADPADGFHWGDAALGAGAALALLALAGAGFLTVRTPKPVPVSSTSAH
jgi:hypothetical protein